MFNAGLLASGKSVSPTKSLEMEQRKKSVLTPAQSKVARTRQIEIGKKPKVMSPERQQYEAKFKRYLDVEAARSVSEEPRRWVRWGRVPGSPDNKKFLKFRERFPDHLSTISFLKQK